jgi:putative transposase
MTVNRAYKFRLYPTDVQAAELAEWERQLRRLYNLAQEQRLNALLRPRVPHDRGQCPSCGVAIEKRSHTSSCAWVDYYRQSREMTPITEEDDQLARVICCARQEILRDLDKAWQRWRKRLGGRPRFKRRTDSARIYFSTPKHWHVDGATLTLTGKASSVGPLKIRQDRPWPGNAKFSSCHIVRDVDEWYAVFPLEFTAPALDRAVTGAVGINRGAIHALADSDGRIVDSPRYYERALERVRLLGRRLSRKLAAAKALGLEPGKNAHKARVKLARKHQIVRRQREWFLHEQSAHYTHRYALVGIEDLSTRQIVADPKIEEAAHWSNCCKRDGCGEKVVKRRLCQKHFDEVRRIPKQAVHRSILDVGWYELARQLKYKGEATGTRVVTVNPGLFDAEQPAGISKTCSRCGAALGVSASGHAVATCDRCGLVELGDVNAGRNVLARALRADGQADGAKPPGPKPRATIKIKGRAKAQTETAGKPPAEACGGDAPVRAPVEAGTVPREGDHPECTVLPRRRPGRQRSPPTHQAKETRD